VVKQVEVAAHLPLVLLEILELLGVVLVAQELHLPCQEHL